MAGDGPLFNTCINMTKQLALENNVIFLGALSHAELLSYYEKAKAMFNIQLQQQMAIWKELLLLY